MKSVVKITGLILLILSVNLLNSCKKDKPTIPLITTTGVTGISISTAVSGGTITDEGGAAVTSRGVCWNTADNPVIDNNKTSETGVSFTSNISQLTPNTTYYVRAYATNIAGTGYGNSITFKTLGDKPTSAAVSATEITTTSATLSGTVNANSLTTKVSFEYGLNINYGNSIDVVQSPISGDSNGSVSVVLTGLNPGSIYNFRIKAENALGITYSDNMNFTTLGGLAIASIQAATNIYLNNAVLNGSINPNYLSTTGAFEWGLTTSYGNYVEIPQGPFTGNKSIVVTQEITGLSVGTTYHFRIETVNWWGTSYSGDMTFKTLGQVPTAVPQQAFDIQYISATLPGTVNPNFLSTTVTFEYGTTTAYGTTLDALPSPITGSTPVNVSVGLYGLTSGTTYHYRIKAINELGTTLSNDMTFTSLAPITDIDGNNYNIKTLGTQVWMTENLKTTKYLNGDIIGTTASPLTDVTSESAPKYQWSYDGNESNVATYGRLYTWFAVSNARKVCPLGWHVPSDAEWTTLTDYLIKNNYGYEGGGNDIAKAMASPTGWMVFGGPGAIGNNPVINNLSGFNGVPSGARIIYYVAGSVVVLFDMLSTSCAWWTNTELDSSLAWQVILQVNNPEVMKTYYGTKKTGASVRCLKD